MNLLKTMISSVYSALQWSTHTIKAYFMIGIQDIAFWCSD